MKISDTLLLSRPYFVPIPTFKGFLWVVLCIEFPSLLFLLRLDLGKACAEAALRGPCPLECGDTGQALQRKANCDKVSQFVTKIVTPVRSHFLSAIYSKVSHAGESRRGELENERTLVARMKPYKRKFYLLEREAVSNWYFVVLSNLSQ